eukprot:XP_011676614.1 PREDICTED: uncharacterized protein LOC105444288 [Strongylocentrotus purpuratus]
MAGNFRKRVSPEECTVADFYNPWTFHSLFLSDPEFILQWLKDQRLLAATMICEECGRECRWTSREKKHHGFTWRCRRKEHREKEYGITRYSFFDRSHFVIQDLLEFIRTFLLGGSLKGCSVQAGMDYKKTSVDWANYTRDLFRKFVDTQYNLQNPVQLQGEVEVDESLFGRRCKYHRGDGSKGVKVWIVGLVERATNKLVLYPVDDRTEKTLLSIIKRHVVPGSTIYSDGWSGYSRLNANGYRHFSVVHKHQFKAVFEEELTGERVEVCTNGIEGAWKHAKDHFRKINGTKISNFEAHLAEVIWRNHVRGQNIFLAFFDLLRQCYPLTGPPELETNVPLFRTWTKCNADTSLQRISDAELEEDREEDHGDDDHGDDHGEALPPRTIGDAEQEEDREENHGDDDDEALPPRTSTPERPGPSTSTKQGKKRKQSTRRVCHPPGYRHINPPSPIQQQGPVLNEYGRGAFVELSSDEDFE